MYFKYNLFKSNVFWAYAKGNLDLEIPHHVSFAGMQIKEEKDIPVFELMPIFTVFGVGPFVVPIVIRRGVVFKFSGAINGNLSFMVPLYCNTSFNICRVLDIKKWNCPVHIQWLL